MTEIMTIEEFNNLPKKKNKFGAKKTEVDGYLFASKHEAERYSQLKLLERSGEIWDIQCQVSYPCMVNGVKVCVYIADFVYKDSTGKTVVEDAKGFRTKEYRIKKKLVQALYGITIFEV